MNDWRPTSEKPKNSQTVLVYVGGRSKPIRFATFWKATRLDPDERWQIEPEYSDDDRGRIRGWMPLPPRLRRKL